MSILYPLYRKASVQGGPIGRLCDRAVLRLGLAEAVAARIAEDCEAVPGPQDGTLAQNAPTLLALSGHAFRGDLSSLAQTGEVRVLRAPYAWQQRLLRSFYDREIIPRRVHAPDGAHAAQQAAYRTFLERMLPLLYRRLGVDAVVGADVRYMADTDWGAVSKALGAPYLVFHRENMLASDEMIEQVENRMRRFGPFQGSLIIVHNNVSRDLFVSTGYAPPDQVRVHGAMRMDAYYETLRTWREEPPARARPLVVFFPFWHLRPWYDYPQTVFDQAHQACALLAATRPDVDVLIKPKPEDWRKTDMEPHLRNALGEVGLTPETLPNYRIDPTANVQEAIGASRVVVAMDTTATLEAAVAGKPVILPCFDVLRHPPYDRRVKFHRDLDCFDLPDDRDDMLTLLVRRIEDPSVPQNNLAARRALFERYVSPLDGRVTQRYLETIGSLLAAPPSISAEAS